MNLDKRIKIRNLDVLTPTGEKFRLRWKEYQILSLLVAKSPELVSRTEIIENIWKGTYCSDSTINQTIKSIRQKIGDVEHTFIRTIPRLGYKVENKAVFHFISEGDEYFIDEIWNVAEGVNEGIQAEDSEIANKDDEISVGEIDAREENIATSGPPVVPATLKNAMNRNKTPASAVFFSVPAIRVVKYLSVFVSLLVISHFSYVLGNQTRPPIINDIQNNTRVVLTLTLDKPLKNSPKTLLCLYQGESLEQASVECVDPKVGQLKQSVKYDTSAFKWKGKINLILPNKTMQYQVAYDVKN